MARLRCPRARRRTINDFLRKQGASDAVIAVLRMTFLGEDFDHVSALQDMVWQPFFDRNKKWMQP